MATAMVSRRSLGYPFEALPVTETPDAAGASGLVTTEAPVTHRIRKLHMKKIMESIRNNVDKRLGAKLSKNHHRSLLTAEQLQGRPMDVELNQVHNAATDDITTDSDVSVADSASSEDGGSFERTDEAVSEIDDEDKGDNFDSRNYDANNDINNVNVGIENVNGDVEVASDSVGDELESDDVNSEDVSNNALEADVDSSSDELGEVLQLADDLDVPDNSMEDIYQNDEYPVTSPSYVTTSSDGSTELNENAKMFTTFTPFLVDGDDSYATEMLSDGIVNSDATTQTPALKPPKKVTTKLQLVPKTTATTKLIPLPTMPTKDVVQSKLALKRAWKNQTISVAPQNEITAIERPLWPTDSVTLTIEPATKVVRVKAKPIKSNGNSIVDPSELPHLVGMIRLESAEMANDTADYSELEPKNYTTNKLLTPAVPSSTAPKVESDEFGWSASNISVEPNHLASTSVGGIGLERQQAYDIEEISFENVGLDNLDDITMDDGHMDNRHAHGFPVSNSGDVSTDVNGGEDGNETEGEDDTNRFLAGVVDAANEDEIYDWDEISRNNRRNLMRGRDVVTKFLQIVETQHLLGANCEAGTSLNLGEGVVDRYAQDRFRVEAEVAVNRANMLSRIFKMTTPSAQADVNLLHASVLSMVEFDDDIFAAGNCFDWNEHPAQTGLFCPFAYRLPAPNLGAILAKDLSMEYHYLGNTSEWFFQARKNAWKVIARNEQYLKSFHLYSNKTEERIEDDTLAVKYEDGRWSKPYYDCGGGNIWMLTYTVPFFGYENGTYHFKGTSGIDIDLRRVDIDQCPQRNTPGSTQPLNIFAGTDKCKQRTTMCEALKGLGFRRGSYKCVCRKGYYFPDTMSNPKFFNGSLLEEEYEKLMLGKNSTYNIINEYECLPCAEGCDYCEDGSPCIAALNWPMRTSIMVLACAVIGLLPPAAWFTFRYQQVK
ncbi:PREDICTED: uncharacterized protein LOC108361963, partial [Rhagoletis zephyria]|uniref:uncharacterized protein LOC108361963 n=1 Tax=Rhagoletis zephyria TaxID=28612 RepID=UPI0008114937